MSSSTVNRRDRYRALAAENLAFFEQGGFPLPDGSWHALKPGIDEARAGTTLRERPMETAQVRRDFETAITLADEDTLEGAGSVVADGFACPAVLNFASARTPGGGFLRGGNAQEESLCRATTLYHALSARDDYYRRNSDHPDSSYDDICLYTPSVEQFRDGYGTLQPGLCEMAVITAAAPNRRAAIEQGVMASLEQRFDQALATRIDLVLSAAHEAEHACVVLGAWGCGVFGNPAERVAGLFSEALAGKFKGAFRRVRFAIPRRLDQESYLVFARTFD